MSRGPLHATAQFNGRSACSGVAKTLVNHRLSQNRCRCGAITGLVFCLRSHLLKQLGSKIFEGIFKFDLAGDRIAVIDDVWRSKLLFENHVATSWADGDADSVCDRINPPFEGAAGLVGERKKLGH